MKQVYLLTGRPGTGKTRLIKEATATMKGKAGGFYTEEIRIGGVRQGFKLVTLDGQSVVLAHIKIRSRYRVGKYGVDIKSLERIGIVALQNAVRQCDIIVVDEIGKMELLSTSFKRIISEMLVSEKRVLGTVMLDSHPWVDAIKRRPEIDLVPLTGANYQHIAAELRDWLKAFDENRS
jgi:nucleoside-triphosphatase